MSTRKLFVLGSCLSADILTENKDIFSKYFDLKNIQLFPDARLSPVIAGLHDLPGSIAARLQDEMSTNRSRLNSKINVIYNIIVKPLRLADVLTKVAPGDVLLIDFHGDMYPMYDDGLERFVVPPAWNKNKIYFPNWLVKKIDSFPTYQADMISKEQSDLRVRNTYSVNDTLTRIFGSNIIAIGSVYTNKQYISELNTVSESILLSDYNIPIPFIKMTASGEEAHINSQYFSRRYDSFDKTVRYKYPNWTQIIPDKSMCFSDPNHKWGPHPCHLHPLSMNQFRKPLEDALIKLCNPSSGSIII